MQKSGTCFGNPTPDHTKGAHLTLEDQITEGEKVAERFTARGTHHGELMGIPPTGKPVTGTGTVISRFVNGKWQVDWSNFDALGMLQQLGVIPSMGEHA